MHTIGIIALVLAVGLAMLLIGWFAGWTSGRGASRDLTALAETQRQQADRAAGAELASRQHSIESSLSPISDALGRVDAQVRAVETERVGAYRELRAQVAAMREGSEELRRQTTQLVSALRAPQIRGRWGELQLEQIVASAGMVEHCDFTTQHSVSTEDGVLRPDLVVTLAGGKHVVVDAKVSFIGFLEAMDASDDATRTARMRAHARHVREHVDRLGDKAYWKRFDASPEFVVMFCPAEVFLNAALEQDPTLLEHAFSRDVVIATPATLIALLRTVAYTWRQEALAENAAEIHRLSKDLYARLATMGGHVDKLGSQLGRAVQAYNATVSSLGSRVLVSARKLTELRVSDAELSPPGQLTEVPRRVQAAELVAAADESLMPLQSDRRQAGA